MSVSKMHLPLGQREEGEKAERSQVMERFMQTGSEVDSETLIAAKKVRVGLRQGRLLPRLLLFVEWLHVHSSHTHP